MKITGHSFVVTGGSGFVGTQLVEALLHGGAERVVIFDKSVTPAASSLAAKKPRVTLVEGDLSNAKLLQEMLSGVHGVFHLAVLPLGDCEKEPRRALDININGTFNLIEAAAQAGVGKVVYSSASSVYGDTLEVMDERHSFHPSTMYGVSKLCGEFLFRPFAKKLPFVVLRYMNVYGPGQTGGLIPLVLSKIRKGEPPVVHGDGSASFDFVHVWDVVRCNLLAMDSEVNGEAFNVGSGTEATVKQIVEWLLEMTKSPLVPVYKTDIPVPMTRRVGSSEKAKRLLGYEASISLRQGLEELVRG